MSLLDNWCWKLNVDQGGFWFKVLGSKYGLGSGRIRSIDNKTSYCWKVLWCVREGVGVSGVSGSEMV